MTKQFTPPKVIRSTSTPLLKQFANRFLPGETSDVNWEMDAGFVNEEIAAIVTYGLSDEARKKEISACLREIYNAYTAKPVTEDAVGFFQKLGLNIPSEIRLSSVTDIVMWAFLTDAEVWGRANKVLEILSIKNSQYHTFFLRREENEPIEDDEDPDLKTLTDTLKEAFKARKEGIGESIAVHFLQYGDRELYICSVSDNSSHLSQFEDGELVSKPITHSKLLVYIYSRTKKTLSISYPKCDKNFRLRLCNIWADVIKGAECMGEEESGIPYHLELLKDPNFIFKRDLTGEIVDVAIKKVTVERAGAGEPTKLTYTTIHALKELLTIINQEKFPFESCRIVEVSLRVTLSESFGRCKTQTLNLKLHSSDLETKNTKVRDVLRKGLVWWGILDE